MWLGVSASYQSARAAFLSKRQRSAQSDLTPTFLHPGFAMAPSSKARSLASMPSEQWMAALLRDLLLLACVGPLLLPITILLHVESWLAAPLGLYVGVMQVRRRERCRSVYRPRRLPVAVTITSDSGHFPLLSGRRPCRRVFCPSGAQPWRPAAAAVGSRWGSGSTGGRGTTLLSVPLSQAALLAALVLMACQMHQKHVAESPALQGACCGSSVCRCRAPRLARIPAQVGAGSNLGFHQ